MRDDAWLVHQLVERSAERRPDAPFVLDGDTTLTFGEARAASWRLARLLVEAGVGRGERVGLLAHNGPLYVAAYYGILAAGAVAVPLNTAANGAALRDVLADCGARTLVLGARFGRVAKEALAALPELELVVAEKADELGTLPAHMRLVSAADAESLDERAPAREPIDRELASIVYTSGSTGRPRGAMLSHLNIVTNTRSIVRYLGLTPEDRVLSVLPFYYVYGKSLLNTHAAAGGSLVVENRFLYPNTALDTLEARGCTGFSGVPSTFAILLNRSTFASRELASLRYVTQAGGAMSPTLTKRLLEVLGENKRLFVMYGATEASARLTYLDPARLPEKIGSIGRAIPNVEVVVRREDGREAEAGEVGELVARGSNIMSGYWNDAEETARVLDGEGWYLTGDLGRRDEEGFLYVVGRKKDMIKAGAHRIASKEIEDAILEHAEVHETAVIGVPDEIFGETIRAYVVFREHQEAESEAAEAAKKELLRFLKRRLPAYKQPASLVVRTELPKNESGKIMKPALRDEAARERAAQGESR